MNAAQTIKDAVDIRAVCELYGVHLDSRGYGLCPFHDDKHPSASVKNGRFRCFVCNLHLDCFDFVMQITGCDFKTAQATLNQSFGLGLDLDKPIPTDEMRRIQRERKRKAEELQAYRDDYNAHQEEFIVLRKLVRAHSRRGDMGLYAWALGRLDQLVEYFTEHPWR